MSRTLIVIGALIILAGIAWPWLSKLPLGHLPGDIAIKRQNFSLFIPVTSMLLISFIVSLILWLINR